MRAPAAREALIGVAAMGLGDLFPQAQAPAEILVLDGELQLTVDSRTRIAEAGTWLRAGGPDAGRCLASMVAGSHGVTVYVKQGTVVERPHLTAAEARS